MKSGSLPRRLLLGMLLAAFIASVAASDDDNDHDDDEHDYERAWRALRDGEIMPLAQVLDAIRHQLDGEVVDVQLEREDGRHVYEFKVLGRDGRLREVYVDAASARILAWEED